VDLVLYGVFFIIIFLYLYIRPLWLWWEESRRYRAVNEQKEESIWEVMGWAVKIHSV